ERTAEPVPVFHSGADPAGGSCVGAAPATHAATGPGRATLLREQEMFETTIAGSLPKPSWLAEPNKLWPQWKLAGDELAAAKADDHRGYHRGPALRRPRQDGYGVRGAAQSGSARAWGGRRRRDPVR